MAQDTINSVRNAETLAQQRIEQAQEESKKSVAEAKAKAERIIASAQDKARAMVEHAEDKALSAADEISVTTRNSARLDAEKLSQSAESKQQAVNKRILEIIV